MIYVIVAIILIAGLLGALLLSYLLQNKNTPKGLVFIHGPLATVGVILLIVYTTLYQPGFFNAIMLFIVAAAMGFVLIYRDLTHKAIPKTLGIIHGSLALLGIIILLVNVFILGK